MSSPRSSPATLKILMLHGYAQSGPRFHAKTRALEKHLQKHLGGASAVELIYVTSPLRLRTCDIPGKDSALYTGSGEEEEGEELESFGWWLTHHSTSPSDISLSDPQSPPINSFLSSTLMYLRTLLSQHTDPPITGAVGFSQGGALCALLASLLEPPSHRNHPSLLLPSPLPHPPLKFAIIYSGFRLPPSPATDPFYSPKISTPTMHFIGGLDTVIEEGRSMALVETCEGAEVVKHPGGHFVPGGKSYADVVMGFVRRCMSEGGGVGSEVGGKGKGHVVEDEDDWEEVGGYF